MKTNEKIEAVLAEAATVLAEYGQPATHATLVGYLASEVVRLQQHIGLCEDIIEVYQRNEK
jgi:hypothetical protein